MDMEDAGLVEKTRELINELFLQRLFVHVLVFTLVPQKKESSQIQMETDLLQNISPRTVGK